MEASNAGNILAHLEKEGFEIQALKRMRLSEAQAQKFYEVHRERPFYNSLVAYMTSGPIIAAALAREDAVARLRKVMGATDPTNADEGTIRALFGSSIERNAIHGSDSPENAQKELHFFFSRAELIAAE
jgi:nucleoside-diphosphate kinase